jgi:diguanylate cyclase (GGDEF)-like protein
MVEALSIQVTNKKGQPANIEVTLSIGVADYPGDANSAEALIDIADQALYQAKRLGCNHVVRYNLEQEK